MLINLIIMFNYYVCTGGRVIKGMVDVVEESEANYPLSEVIYN